jgi:hypothetical protein
LDEIISECLGDFVGILVPAAAPHQGYAWKPSTLNAPASKPGRLQYVGREVVPEVSKRLNAGQRWTVSHDSSSQWLCIGESAHGEMIAFAPGAVDVLR